MAFFPFPNVWLRWEWSRGNRDRFLRVSVTLHLRRVCVVSGPFFVFQSRCIRYSARTTNSLSINMRCSFHHTSSYSHASRRLQCRGHYISKCLWPPKKRVGYGLIEANRKLWSKPIKSVNRFIPMLLEGCCISLSHRKVPPNLELLRVNNIQQVSFPFSRVISPFPQAMSVLSISAANHLVVHVDPCLVWKSSYFLHSFSSRVQAT